jgi:hypothetical protein
MDGSAFNRRRADMLSTNFRIKVFAIAMTAGAAGVAVPVPAAATPILRVFCDINSTAITVSKTAQTTTSTSYVDVADSGITFKQGGTKNSCVIVSLSSEASAAANTTMEVQAVIDKGAIICQPGPGNFFVTSNATATGLADRAMNYVCNGVAPGGHVAKLQFLSSNGGSVELDYRTVIVHYLK